jgi:hypothetical protein
MKSEIISLGGACDVGIALQWMKVKGLSYPFDWLANLDGGLSVVLDILNNNFETVNRRESYEIKRLSPGSEGSVVYKFYPEVSHLHSNPLANQEDHASLVRRMDRFRAALDDQNLFINFIFYRNFDAPNLREGGGSLESALDLLRTEGAAFVDFLRRKYPKKLFSLTLVMQTSVELSRTALGGLGELARSNGVPEIKYGFTITRPDDDPGLKALWRKQWCEIVLECCRLKITQRARVRMKWMQQCISLVFKRWRI